MRATILPLAFMLMAALWALVSIIALGEYCDPHTASSVFLIFYYPTIPIFKSVFSICTI